MNTKNSRGRGKKSLQFEKSALLTQENFNDLFDTKKPCLAEEVEASWEISRTIKNVIIQILTFNPSGIGGGFFPLFRHDTSF